MYPRTGTVLLAVVGVFGVFGVLAPGCPGPAAAPPAVTPAPASLSGVCGTWLCQTNSASMGDKLFFHELDASSNLPNAAQIRYVRFEDASRAPLTLRISGHAITATDASGAFHQGTRLVGATLVLEVTRGSTIELFDVRIKDVGEIAFWVRPDLERVPTYTFEYRSQSPRSGTGDANVFEPLCTSKDTSSEWDRQAGVDRALALVFAGDRYDPHTKKVTTGPELELEQRRDGSRWFNVACAGSALAKMHLLRHTAAGVAGIAGGQLSTTADERQAMLRMLTDDICGTGYSFTVDGEDVFYMDAKGWHPFAPAQARTVEAIWTKEGAFCLDEPRRLVEDQTILSGITAECAKTRPVRSCRTPSPGEPVYDLSNWQQAPGAYGVSANP
jgi:hypothetical protein